MEQGGSWRNSRRSLELWAGCRGRKCSAQAGPQDFALWRSAHWVWAMAQEVGSLGLVGSREDVSPVGRAWGVWALG